MLVERLAVSAVALLRRVDRDAAAEETDPAVPGGDQVRDRVASAADVVAEDGVGVEEARRAVEEHEWDATGALAQVAVIGSGGHDDQGVDAAGGERRGEPALLLGVLVGAARQRHDVAGARHFLDSAMRPRRRTGCRCPP